MRSGEVKAAASLSRRGGNYDDCTVTFLGFSDSCGLVSTFSLVRGRIVSFFTFTFCP